VWSGPPGWGLSAGLTILPSKKTIVQELNNKTTRLEKKLYYTKPIFS